jgi:hypothetical protein
MASKKGSQSPKDPNEDLIEGSRNLAKAIFETGKVYSKMTIAEQFEGKMYAGVLGDNTYIGLIKAKGEL